MSGRTIMVCPGEVAAERGDGTQQTVALMQATMMVGRDRAGVSDQRAPSPTEWVYAFG